jgi:phenylacetate-CoA ligase
MSQIIQEDLENLTVRIVKSGQYTKDEEIELIAGLQARFGEGMKIRVEYVVKIDRSQSGKFKWVVSKVPLTFI